MVLDPYIESVLIFTGINIVLALSLYLPVSAGLLSLGQGGFMAIGAYGSAYLTTELHWPFAGALVSGGLVAGIVGLLVGIPSLRIKGVYLVIMTLGFGEIVRVFFLNFEPTGAASGLGGIPTYTTLPVVAIVVALTLLLCFQLRGSRIGRAIEAVREDELAAEVIGINLTRIKVAVFGLGAFVAGIGGGLFAHYATFIDPAQFAFQRSAEIFIMVVLGGMGNFAGAALGAVVVTVLPELLRLGNAQEWRMTVFGALLIAIMIVRPWGLLGVRR
jgi:branched-chain amino acid transport system permease protein